ncbi:MAG: hypothetical protein ABSA41_04740 [Terriglobia bacterium]|jgi:hypothetical protein
MGPASIHLLLLALVQGFLSPISAALLPSLPLDLGYRQMYNLEFSDAHRTFQVYQQSQPDDPLGPTSDAAAYLFEEFNRLGVLQTELFVDDEKFKDRQKPAPDPELRENFRRAITKSQRLADEILKRSPKDRNALFATVLNLGLQSDYLALVEKRDLASLSYTKRAGLMADRLLAIDPSCYDAYLAIGVENYVLGLKPAPVRWLLRLYGAETDKELGLQKLQLTAEKGHYLLPFARLLLAVAALRDKDRSRARELLQNLAQEFPNNQLYRRELSRLQ